jgi:hypothetical protein
MLAAAFDAAQLLTPCELDDVIALPERVDERVLRTSHPNGGRKPAIAREELS